MLILREIARTLLIGAVQLNVNVGADRRSVGDACVTFLLGLFRWRSIGDVRRIAATCGDLRRRCNTGEILRRRRSAT